MRISLLFLLALSVQAAEFEAEVIGVMDGDTVKVFTSDKEEIKIRLEHIDAPEKRQPFGQVCKGMLSDMIFGKTVYIRSQKRPDRYGRMIAEVFMCEASKESVNIAMVRQGCAWHYKAFSKDSTYAEAERIARESRAGLWKDESPVAPWNWRKKK
jgi:endonuclease YncB( thermonuclease family)